MPLPDDLFEGYCLTLTSVIHKVTTWQPHHGACWENTTRGTVVGPCVSERCPPPETHSHSGARCCITDARSQYVSAASYVWTICGPPAALCLHSVHPELPRYNSNHSGVLRSSKDNTDLIRPSSNYPLSHCGVQSGFFF